jgi:hypothetical protein
MHRSQDEGVVVDVLMLFQRCCPFSSLLLRRAVISPLEIDPMA